jgi:hypothetical protein
MSRCHNSADIAIRVVARFESLDWWWPCGPFSASFAEKALNRRGHEGFAKGAKTGTGTQNLRHYHNSASFREDQDALYCG